MKFELFDPQDEVRITAGRLPHWFQPSVTYFVTFRTDDSMPAEVTELWHRRRNDWLKRHDIDPTKQTWQATLQKLPKPQQSEFHGLFSDEFLNELDKGYGECVLKQQQFAIIVANSLKHFDGDRYHLGDFVVMPNHVHVLVCLRGFTDITELCHSWKKFTATKINRALQQQGRFWQEESFDHLVRSPEQFAHFQRYIAANGSAAGLKEGEFLYWRSGHVD